MPFTLTTKLSPELLAAVEAAARAVLARGERPTGRALAAALDQPLSVGAALAYREALVALDRIAPPGDWPRGTASDHGFRSTVKGLGAADAEEVARRTEVERTRSLAAHRRQGGPQAPLDRPPRVVRVRLPERGPS